MEYPDFCIRAYTPPKKSDAELCVDLILEHEDVQSLEPDVKTRLLEEFYQLMQTHWGSFDVRRYRTLASLGQGLLCHTGCFDGVVEIRGHPYEFIRKCLKNAIIQTPNDTPLRVEGQMLQIDRRGSYTAIYRDFLGIPKGRPFVIPDEKSWRDGKWHYYYVCINITYLRLPDVGFPLPLELGKNWVDKVFMEHVMKIQLVISFTFVSGYGFRMGFNTKIRDVAVKLWDIREKLRAEGSPLQLILKRLLNTLWGKSIAKIWDVRVRGVEESKLVGMLTRNAGFIYEMHRIGEKMWSVALARPILKAYRMPQFGVNVCSSSIIGMHSIICEALKMGVQILYTNTDCLCFQMDKKGVMMKWMGEELGQFSEEFKSISRKFICLS
jgi:hypothetical protein